MRSPASIHCVIQHLPTPTCLVRRSLRDPLYSSPPSLQSQNRLFHRLPYSAIISRTALHLQQNHHLPAGPLLLSSFSSSSTPTMSSDDAYMSFLDKANADLDAGRASQPSSTIRTQTVHTALKVPAPLRSVDAYYVSETDEPFEPVALKWDGAAHGTWPSAAQLSSLISPDADLSNAISTLSPNSFDPKNEYASALHAVRAAAVEKAEGGDQSNVDVKVYRVQLDKTRVEYWVLALHAPESQLVGLRAKAVET
ncbi:hypothetical protein N7474_011068 [Penicillium riverlandense]|uniref:uncharacterized protein n=1 Tax=Penicillium riverlandense TaxID=1903569 RepID=UPI002548025C|nr:uncharacterized protein N7474_011068 [Penicillium riverlandense]KAJ5805181.1 hypothetical protein N7474_011068 [Penicillium riverlandense]